MKLLKLINGELLVDIAAAAVKKIRNRPKAVARRAAKAARKAKRDGPQPDDSGEFFSVEPTEGVREMGLLLELLGSLARTTLPVARAFLDSHGIHITGDSTTTTLLIVGLWAGAQVWSWVRKVRNKPRAVESKPSA